MVIRYLPPYTPDLNNSEGQWRGLKKATANRLYKAVDAMQKSICVMLHRGKIKVVEMNKWLT